MYRCAGFTPAIEQYVTLWDPNLVFLSYSILVQMDLRCSFQVAEGG